MIGLFEQLFADIQGSVIFLNEPAGSADTY
jgi:hypothetical protein